jgi:hypothetical protein
LLVPFPHKGKPLAVTLAPLDPLVDPASELLLDVAGIASTNATSCAFAVGEFPVTTEPLAGGVAPAAVSSEEMPLLMLTNCCRLFTSTICVMYAFGSVGCVGSWFFISATKSVRKSFAVIDAVFESVDDEDDGVDAEASLGFDSALATVVAELDICGELVNIC